MGRVIFTAKHSDGKTKVTIDVPGMDEDPSGIADVVLQHGPNSRTVTIENFTVGEAMDTISKWTSERLKVERKRES